MDGISRAGGSAHPAATGEPLSWPKARVPQEQKARPGQGRSLPAFAQRVVPLCVTSTLRLPQPSTGLSQGLVSKVSLGRGAHLGNQGEHSRCLPGGLFPEEPAEKALALAPSCRGQGAQT